MIYEIETLMATLKAAREKKGLSQRGLSARSGVPQSHISKIEKAGVDLRISSLNAIANALDLEVILVPRKAVPVVKSISRSAVAAPIVLDSVKQFAKGLQQLQDTMKAITKPDRVNALQNPVKQISEIHNATKRISKMRDALAFTLVDNELPKLPRPAYELNDDD